MGTLYFSKLLSGGRTKGLRIALITLFCLGYSLMASSQIASARLMDNNINKKYKKLLQIYKNNKNRDTVLLHTENDAKPYSTPDKNVVGESSLKGLLLPETYIKMEKNGNKAIIFSILIDTLSALKYDAQKDIYSGTFNIVLVEDTAGISSQKKLKKPVEIEVSTASGAEVSPSVISIDHTNLPSTVIHVVDKSKTNPLPVLIKTSSNPAGYTVHLNKEARLCIETPARSIQGLGVQSIPINISLQNYYGPDAINASVTVNKGSVSPARITVFKDSISTVMLTSESLGNAELKISAGGISGDQRTYKYCFPWIFLLFAVVGSFLGALVKHFTGKGKKNFGKTIGLGVITGFIFAILYYVLGITLFSIKTGFLINEFAVLGLSFLGALFWGTIYNILKGKLFPSKTENPN